MRSDAVIYHPFLLEKLGLEDPGDFLKRAKQDPRFPRGSGRTTRMKLQILQALVAGQDVLVVAYSRDRAEGIVVDLRRWCAKLSYVLREGQLRAAGAPDEEQAQLSFDGAVFYDHFFPDLTERSYHRPKPNPTLWQRFMAWLRRLWLQLCGVLPW